MPRAIALRANGVVRLSVVDAIRGVSIAVAADVDALFLEVHDDPVNAKNAAATVWPLEQLEPLLPTYAAIHAVVA